MSSTACEKLTTKFQEALADAQSMAVANSNPYIEPAHLLAAMLEGLLLRGAGTPAEFPGQGNDPQYP